MMYRTCRVQIQPRKHVSDNADHTAPTLQHELKISPITNGSALYDLDQNMSCSLQMRIKSCLQDIAQQHELDPTHREYIIEIIQRKSMIWPTREIDYIRRISHLDFVHHLSQRAIRFHSRCCQMPCVQSPLVQIAIVQRISRNDAPRRHAQG